ncbi:uncharacterized protein LOC132717920 [Ruditapes philippinarum]|uniref:uncharacterized protein LOC132717920 n=1 Tax=Ruditapes philippinarum TaxID=129788 RepID=UPI00295B8DBD|nr:uncharacterized protein LOC132717920 [Ruditapes philippinarum]
MSTGFRYSYRDITNLDIRHIYSGNIVSSGYRLRPPVSHDGINYLDRIHENMIRAKAFKWPEKSFEYNRKYKTVMPRAPAFETLSRKKVENVVERLTSPSDTNEPKEEQETSGTDSEPTETVVATDDKPVTSSESNKAKGKQDSDKNGTSNVFDRLYRSKTQITILRQREKVVLQPKSATSNRKAKKK